MKLRLSINIVLILTLCLSFAYSEQVSVQVEKVADLPVVGGDPGISPQSPRGGILQMGNDLWFMTNEGGENSLGAVVSYNLSSKTFSTHHSFGLTDPMNPTTARYDGNSPWKATLFQDADGRVYYTTQYGGESNTSQSNGGAVGWFNPATVAVDGVNVVWSGGTTGTEPRRLINEAVYVNNGTTESLYILTNSGGTNSRGTVQKAVIDNGSLVSSSQIVDFWGDSPSTRQPQGGMLLVGDKLYYTTGSGASGAAISLQSIDTATDTRTVLSTTWSTTRSSGSQTGSYSTPIYDSTRNAIYSVSLQGGILKWDITTGTQSILPGSEVDLTGSNFADPILFGESIYYIKQASSTTGGQLFRYDLESEELIHLSDLIGYDGYASSQSGSFSIVMEDGISYLYFLTNAGGAIPGKNGMGALFRLGISPIPEPSSFLLLTLVGSAAFACRFVRRRKNI